MKIVKKFINEYTLTYQSGGKEWYRDEMLHREDGPAVEYANGEKAWYINNNECYLGDNPVSTDEEFELWKKLQILL